MSYPRRNTVTVVTAADGTATAFVGDEDGGAIRGHISYVRYIKTDYTDGVDFTITTENSGITVWTESNVNAAATKFPTLLTHDDVGVAATARDSIPLVLERLKIVLAAGGATKTGAFELAWV